MRPDTSQNICFTETMMESDQEKLSASATLQEKTPDLMVLLTLIHYNVQNYT